MPTSLAEQLQKLRKPQTTLLSQNKKRPSLLFSPKEAANLDRETIYNIGHNGLEDLIKLSSAFEEFEINLFATSAIKFERSIHDTNINKKIDNAVEKFLIILSPYFLLNCAHKALEWLIYRFHIHEFNKDEFLMLILPYHETRIFVRALQLVDLTNVSDKWHWLEPLQKPGVPLSSLTLVNRVACDNGLLKLLCNHVVTASITITEINNGEEAAAGALSSLYAFYTMTIVGTIERVPKISQVQIDHLLPALVKGMSSPIVDFATSNCMILAKLSHHVQLNNETMEHLLLKALKNPQLTSQITLLLIFLYESPYNRSFAAIISKKLLLRISKLSSSWFCDEINRMQKSLQLNVSKFLIPFFESAINFILNSYDDSDNQMQLDKIKNMMEEILNRITLQNDDVDIILNNTFKCSNLMKNLSTVAKDLLIKLYSAVELKYPERFDEYLKTVIKQSETNIKAKEILQFFLSCGYCGVKNIKGSLNILDGLNHYSVEQRIIALETLSNSVNVMVDDISESLQVMVKEALSERFNDDDVRVVKVLLERFSLEYLKNLFSIDTLIDRLMILLSRCHTKERRVLAQPALKLLLQLCTEHNDHIDDDNDTNIFVATLPYLFPSHNDEVDVAIYILQSEFAKKNKYLLAVKNDVMRGGIKSFDAESIRSASFHNILNWELLPPTEKIVNTIKLSYNSSCNGNGGGDATSLFFNLILLGSVCRVPVGSLEAHVAREIIQITAKIIQQYPKVKSLSKCNQLNGDKIHDALQLTTRGILPLQAGTYVLEMVHRRLNLQSNSILDFENNCEYAQLIVGLLDVLFDGMNSTKHRPLYSWCLKIFFQRHFQTTRDMLRFLAQFFIKPVKPQISLHCLKIAIAVLKIQCKNDGNGENSIDWIFNDEIFTVNLLVALSRINKECREAALEILIEITSNCMSTSTSCFALFSKLREKSTDMLMDAEQVGMILYNLLSPDPDVKCQLDRDVRSELEEAREFFMNIILNNKLPIHATSQLLQVLVHVNGSKMVEQLICNVGCRLLDELNVTNDERHLGNKIFTKMMLKNILERFNSTTAVALTVDSVWKFFDLAINNYDIKIPMENEGGKTIQTQLPTSVILLRQIDDVFFENCGKSRNLQEKILSKLVDIVTDCEINTIVTAANKAARRITVDARLFADELRKMSIISVGTVSTVVGEKKKKIQAQRRRGEMVMINRREWKRGITILEFIQRTDNIINEEYLIKILFDLLRMCLAECDSEPSPSVEYTNQLVLSTIHRFVIKELPIPDAHEQVELVSQCIRISRNPQTHHHALIVLVELFKIAQVDIALHNIMPIFTFMGNSVLRQDDAYSIQIISKIIETVVPIILVENNEIHACTILRIFIVSLPDIPEHRRIPLFIKLLELMKNNLYCFYLILFECHVKVIQQDYQSNICSSSSSLLQRLEFALTISDEFSPNVLIQLCVKLIEFLRCLPLEIDDSGEKKYKSNKKYIFDVENSTPKQLRHYKYTIVQFLSALISNSDFINRVATLDVRETEQLIPYYNNLLIQLIMMIESVSKSADLHQGKPKGRYWKVLVHNLYDILDGVNRLLPNDIFIMTIKKLIDPNQMVMMTVQRKAIELMNTRLQQRKFNDDNCDHLLTLIDPLLTIITKNNSNEREMLMVNQEMDMIQQTAVITLKLLAKNWANENPEPFQPVLAVLAEKLIEMKDGPLLGSIVLGVAELCSTMRTHAIKYINQFVPAVIKLLNRHCNSYDSPSSSIFIISIVTALQKIVESMGNFLSLYLDELFIELCRSSCLYNVDNININDNENRAKIGTVVARIQATSVKLSSCVPLRVLLPAVEKTYNKLMEMKLYRCIGPLMGILSESFNHITGNDVEMLLTDISQLFLHLLQTRHVIMNEISITNSNRIDNINGNNIINEIEDSVGKAIVSLVLKLSEATFRPFYYKLYDWAVRNDGEYKERNITFYRLSYNIADSLKSLFVLFAGHILNHAALLLSHNTMITNSDRHLDMNKHDEYRIDEVSSRIELIDAILRTLNKVFSYDPHHFINKERFEMLAEPIIDQIENVMSMNEYDHEKRVQELIIPCVGAFVSAIQDDSLHKQVVYQTLLKTRNATAHVRRTGLGALLEIAKKLGEDFMPLLSETIPFIAELLEDEDEVTEKAAQNAVRALEEILGEPLQKYF